MQSIPGRYLFLSYLFLFCSGNFHSHILSIRKSKNVYVTFPAFLAPISASLFCFSNGYQFAFQVLCIFYSFISLVMIFAAIHCLCAFLVHLIFVLLRLLKKHSLFFIIVEKGRRRAPIRSQCINHTNKPITLRKNGIQTREEKSLSYRG